MTEDLNTARAWVSTYKGGYIVVAKPFHLSWGATFYRTVGSR